MLCCREAKLLQDLEHLERASQVLAMCDTSDNSALLAPLQVHVLA